MSSTSMSPFKRVVTIISGLAFLGFMGTQIQSMVVQGMQKTQQQEQQARQAHQQKLKQLQAQEDGYEKVLKREPNNEAALQGLAQARIDMKDYKGAVKPLKQLIQLNPEEEHYKNLLISLEQRVAKKDNQ